VSVDLAVDAWQDLEGMNTFQRQYWEIKKQHWDKIIFCRNGVFWGASSLPLLVVEGLNGSF
jgi:hypothetical protein